MSNHSPTIVYRICPVCADYSDPIIIIDKYLSNSAIEKLRKVHNEILGYMDNLCPTCKELINDKTVAVVLLDREKTKSVDDPYRTGDVLIVEKELFKEPVDEFCFMYEDEAIELGLLKED